MARASHSPKSRFTSRVSDGTRNTGPMLPIQTTRGTWPARMDSGQPPALLEPPWPSQLPARSRPRANPHRRRPYLLGRLVEEKESDGTGNRQIAAESACAPSTLRACVTMRAARCAPPLAPPGPAAMFSAAERSGGAGERASRDRLLPGVGPPRGHMRRLPHLPSSSAVSGRLKIARC